MSVGGIINLAIEENQIHYDQGQAMLKNNISSKETRSSYKKVFHHLFTYKVFNFLVQIRK